MITVKLQRSANYEIASFLHTLAKSFVGVPYSKPLKQVEEVFV